MGINLDTDNNGFGGSDFGLLFDISAAPIVTLKNPKTGLPVFKFGGKGGGITATATAYYVRKKQLCIMNHELKGTKTDAGHDNNMCVCALG